VSAPRLVQEIVTERPKRIYRACCYCGRPCSGPACRDHRDLLALDPNYQLRKGARAA
jgi:hypothetical protein